MCLIVSTIYLHAKVCFDPIKITPFAPLQKWPTLNPGGLTTPLPTPIFKSLCQLIRHICMQKYQFLCKIIFCQVLSLYLHPYWRWEPFSENTFKNSKFSFILLYRLLKILLAKITLQLKVPFSHTLKKQVYFILKHNLTIDSANSGSKSS